MLSTVWLCINMPKTKCRQWDSIQSNSYLKCSGSSTDSSGVHLSLFLTKQPRVGVKQYCSLSDMAPCAEAMYIDFVCVFFFFFGVVFVFFNAVICHIKLIWLKCSFLQSFFHLLLFGKLHMKFYDLHLPFTSHWPLSSFPPDRPKISK